MTLVTNIAGNSHKDVICELIENADRCILCTSFFDMNGLNLLMPSINLGIKKNNLKIKIFSNGENKYTKKSVIQKVKKISQIEHRIFYAEGRRLHTKLYYFEKDDKFTAVLGSANLTENGLINNEELSVRLEGLLYSTEQKNFKEYMDKLESSML